MVVEIVGGQAEQTLGVVGAHTAVVDTGYTLVGVQVVARGALAAVGGVAAGAAPQRALAAVAATHEVWIGAVHAAAAI